MQPQLIPNAKILIVGEAPGHEEAVLEAPFMGPAGQELTRMLDDAGIRRADVSLTNVFSEQPPGNKLAEWQIDKSVWMRMNKEFGHGTPERALYLDPIRVDRELKRLAREVEQARPNLILAVGNTALWALTGETGIGKRRGTIMAAKPMFGSRKVLATYHPAAVLREYSHRYIAVADMQKARREAEFPEIIRPTRFVHIPETVEDILDFGRKHIEPHAERPDGLLLSVDIETAIQQITCIGLAIDRAHVLVVPLWGQRHGNGSYWESHEEPHVWHWLKGVLQAPYPKVFQNGMYDVQYLYRMNIRVANFSHDTMLKHHAIYSQMPKGLDFLGSLYTDEPAWKLMKPRARAKLKRDE